MNCDQLESYLDKLMDDELGPDALAELEAHAKSCEACSREITAAKQLKAMLSELSPEVDVPLEAQAKWRGAVKAEAAGSKRRRTIRWAGSIAAAAVVLLGVTLAMRPSSNDMNAKSFDAVPVAESQILEEAEADEEAAYELAVVESDGLTMGAAEAPHLERSAAEAFVSETDAMPEPAPMQEISFVVEDMDTACSYICDLVKEYDGTVAEQRHDSGDSVCVNLFIEMPADNAEAFLKAAAHYDRSGEDLEPQFANDASEVSLLMVIRAQ
ncbi:MAG: zf-HC2 domain-containing protein [Clostridia bacterium]|nr:zf-HC2 domain-containing protein [Clostridia bacterium]